MPATLPAGPFKTVETGNGPAPWYIVPFDKRGTCTGPLTRKHLVDEISDKNFTDAFLFSHGWNNDWEAASTRYENFIADFIKMRGEYELESPPDYRPVLAGVFWPSTALVMPWEKGPRFAASTGGSVESEVASWQRELSEIAADMEVGSREEFYSLAQATRLDDTQANRLADILSRVVDGYTEADAEAAGGLPKSPSGARLLERARKLGKARGARSRVPGEFGFIDEPATVPQAAFGLSGLDPRGLIRAATVLQMKDRAGTVGKIGVGPLLRDMLKADPNLRVHLVGHSYGAIVVLSALCNIPSADLTGAVSSALLLQPAVSQWCFAEDVDGEGFPGGYRSALERVAAPIFTTFSRNDGPLTRMFHLAVRRDRDKGQPLMAADADLPTPPSSFAALGGFGPAGLTRDELQVIDMTTPVTRYPIRNPAPKVVALRGDRTIPSHGDVSVPATWWALFQQVEAGIAAE